MPNDTTVNGVAPAGIVADDLTGATDSAVQFAREGWAARLALTMPAAESAVAGSVVAVVTDARAQDADTARANTASAVVGLRDSGAERLFVKIDSTMRGSVIDQVAGALDGWSSEHPDAVAVVCSAYPAMGRTVDNGHILVNGEGVHTTSVGTDPVTPVTTSDLTVLLPGSVPVRLSDGSAQQNADLLQAAFAGGSRIAVVDAKTDADLALLAESVTLLGPRAIPVGAAGLAVAMSHVWSTGLDAAVHGTRVPVKRVAVVVSSLHDVSRAQAERLKGDVPEQLLRTFAPGLDVALDPDAIGEWIAARLAETVTLPPVVVIESPSERPGGSVPEGERTPPELIAESLATITEAVFDHESVDGLVLLGGEGARAVLEHLGAEALLVRDAIREGIPLGALEGGKADGITVVTKAGGFGEPTAVAEIVSELLGATALTATELNNTEGTS
jgi:uncharacterized protein YgbK (DUF1537 family)